MSFSEQSIKEASFDVYSEIQEKIECRFEESMEVKGWKKEDSIDSDID